MCVRVVRMAFFYGQGAKKICVYGPLAIIVITGKWSLCFVTVIY